MKPITLILISLMYVSALTIHLGTMTGHIEPTNANIIIGAFMLFVSVLINIAFLCLKELAKIARNTLIVYHELAEILNQEEEQCTNQES